MQKRPAKQPSAPNFKTLPEDVGDCLQCLIMLYGEIQIDTLAELLNLTDYAAAEYAHLCVKRLR